MGLAFARTTERRNAGSTRRLVGAVRERPTDPRWTITVPFASTEEHRS